MADLVLANFVKETTTTTGTGTYSLAGAATGHQGFVAGVGGGSKVPYFVTDGTNWEHGLGTVTDAATDTISRDKIYASSNSGNAVNWSAGTRDIYVAESAHRPRAIHTITGNTTLGYVQNTVLCNSASAFTVTLPAAADFEGKEYTIVNINTGVVTIDGKLTEAIRDPVFGSAETLLLYVTYDSVTIVSDGSLWWVIKKNLAPHHGEVEIAAATSIVPTDTRVPFDTINYQRGASCDLSNNHEILINRTGKYHVYGNIYLPLVDTNVLRMRIVDASDNAFSFNRTSASTSNSFSCQLSTIANITAGTRLGAWVTHANSAQNSSTTPGLKPVMGALEIL